MDPARCSVPFCRCKAVSESSVTSQPLCTSHMKDEITELEEYEAFVADRIQNFKKYQAPMKLMQQRLASDLQLLHDTFSDLKQTLDRCQSELISVVTKQHDQLLDSLTSISELEDFEKELKRAKDENNMRQAFIINSSMKKSLKTLQLDSRLVRMNEESQNIEIAAYPDLSSRIMELQVGLGSELVLLKKNIEQFNFANSEQLDEVELQAAKIFESDRLSETETALCFTVCNNTEGFGLDSSGSISKAAEDSGVTQLPQPSIFVAVEVADSESSVVHSESSGSPSEFIIVLLSADAEVEGRLPCSWEADQPIRDLHCDNERQLLFIAQKQAVTVADLSGVLKSRISVSDLQEDARKLYCIAGNKDKLFTLIKEQSGGLAVVGICKDSRQLQVTFPVPDDCKLMAKTTKMAVRDRMLFLSDPVDFFTICIITEKLVSSRSFNEKVFGMDSLFKESYSDLLTIVQANLSNKSNSAEFQLVPCISPLVSVPTSNAPQYILSTDGDTEYRLVKLEDGNVIETWQIDYVARRPIEECDSATF